MKLQLKELLLVILTLSFVTLTNAAIAQEPPRQGSFAVTGTERDFVTFRYSLDGNERNLGVDNMQSLGSLSTTGSIMGAESDGMSIFVETGNGVYRYDTLTGNRVPILGEGEVISALAINGGGDMLAAGTLDNELLLFDLDSEPHALTNRINLPGVPQRITFFGGNDDLVVLDRPNAHILQGPNYSTMQTIELENGDGIVDLAGTDEGRLFFANGTNDQIGELDPQTGDVLLGVPENSPSKVINAGDGILISTGPDGATIWDENLQEINTVPSSGDVLDCDCTRSVENEKSECVMLSMDILNETVRRRARVFDRDTGTVLLSTPVGGFLSSPEFTAISRVQRPLPEPTPSFQFDEMGIDRQSNGAFFVEGSGFPTSGQGMDMFRGFQRAAAVPGGWSGLNGGDWGPGNTFGLTPSSPTDIVVLHGSSLPDPNGESPAIPIVGGSVNDGSNGLEDQFTSLRGDFSGGPPRMWENVPFTAEFGASMSIQQVTAEDVEWWKRPNYGTAAYNDSNNPWQKVCTGALSCTTSFPLAGAWVILAKPPSGLPTIGMSVYVPVETARIE